MPESALRRVNAVRRSFRRRSGPVYGRGGRSRKRQGEQTDFPFHS